MNNRERLLKSTNTDLGQYISIWNGNENVAKFIQWLSQPYNVMSKKKDYTNRKYLDSLSDKQFAKWIALLTFKPHYVNKYVRWLHEDYKTDKLNFSYFKNFNF